MSAIFMAAKLRIKVKTVGRKPKKQLMLLAFGKSSYLCAPKIMAESGE
jgi:hypothetical protein